MEKWNEADYSGEFEDVLQLIARLGISITSLVDPVLRKDIELTIQNSNEIPAYDLSAALQIISKIEIDSNALLHTPDQKKLLQQRIQEGPLTENHLIVVKLCCDSEVHGTSVAGHENKTQNLLIRPSGESDPLSKSSLSAVGISETRGQAHRL